MEKKLSEEQQKYEDYRKKRSEAGKKSVQEMSKQPFFFQQVIEQRDRLGAESNKRNKNGQ